MRISGQLPILFALPFASRLSIRIFLANTESSAISYPSVPSRGNKIGNPVTLVRVWFAIGWGKVFIKVALYGEMI